MLKGEPSWITSRSRSGSAGSKAFTIIGARHDSSVHDSVAGALGWLSGRFIASVMSTEVEVPGCTAAIFEVDAEEVMVQWHGSTDELADLLDRLAK
jgi:hypothetical protein